MKHQPIPKCTLFDPLQSDVTYRNLESAIKNVICPQLNLSNGILFDRWTEIKQKDGHSCGIWSLTFLEMKLSGASWRGQFYNFKNCTEFVFCC
ncbi:hypothetical protein PHMEG_00021829 [Phytophthora megakarya]|uniref:Ubiquitin-like protease family profile domain-containing protein n=1 Tax=Phytophthora megakarya TaxID=4795 RepID=A0A225VN76_9STRA|nr:hypothetical protein PHMEG_00021829 [Phytophthora megakarya]